MPLHSELNAKVMKILRITSFLIFIILLSCEKEFTSPGNGRYGSQLLTVGLAYWYDQKPRIFSGTKGIIIDGVVRGGGLKYGKVTMIDTLTLIEYYQKSRSNKDGDHFAFKDTVFIPNVTDTLFCKIVIEGKDDDEEEHAIRYLKVGK